MDDAAHYDGQDGLVADRGSYPTSAPADIFGLPPPAMRRRRRRLQGSRAEADLPSARGAHDDLQRVRPERGGSLIANMVGADGLMRDFSVTMINHLRFSSCEAPWQAITRPRKELLAVAYRDDHLTLTELKADGSPGSRIYAQRSVVMPDAMTFLILSRLPSRIRDSAFFPASGTAIVHAPADGSPRRLSAVGTDVNSGRCHGWMFDAVETDARDGSGSGPM